MEPAFPSLPPDFLRGKQVVILGAGYLGSAVGREALAAGARVTALTRNPERGAALSAAGAQVLQAELSGVGWHGAVSPESDYVLDCVGAAGGGLAGYRRSYVDGLRSILAWSAGASHPGVLVYTSSTAVYPQDGGVRVAEDAPTTGGDERAAVLLEAEELAMTWPGRAVVVRLAGIYGPGRHHLLDTLRAGADEMPGRGEHRLNLIHRDDAAALILAAFARPDVAAGQIFNAADDGAVSKRDVVQWLAARLGRPAPSFSGNPVAGRRAVTPDRIIDNGKAKRLLGWRPRFPSYREGYAAIVPGFGVEKRFGETA